jgi:2-polyprenyl-3-methyl-5-hydroxy-6-metoxy-1,4-benzoquinol methylase
MPRTREHWDQVYGTKLETEVSWYQSRPERSLDLIKLAAPLKASILDVGGGASLLADELLSLGYSDVTVLDVSQAALDRSKSRLGRLADSVSWIAADITQWTPPRTWDVWHDRAVFHFLTETKDQDLYIATLKAGTKPGSVAVISTFALDGPERCSGLPVQRYNPVGLAARIGSEFDLVSEASESHKTPWGSTQNFAYAVLRRR